MAPLEQREEQADLGWLDLDVPNLELKLWEQEVFGLLLSEGKINDEVAANIRSWKHSGFSVDQSVRLEAGDRAGIQRLIQYFLRCPFSQARMIEVTEAGKVLYKTGDNRLGRFPEAASDDLLPGPKRNFQIFDPLDFLAEVTQHIPETGEHLIRYYGWYSNKKRGQRAQAQPPPPEGSAAPPWASSAQEARKRWAALIKQVYETDPLICPKCGSEMKIIAFIERRQTEVVEKLRCGQLEAHLRLCRRGAKIRVSRTLFRGSGGRIPALGGLRRPPKAGTLTPSHLKGLISCDNTPERSGSVSAMKKQIPMSS